ncbi:carboxylate-amine ligase [Nocardia tengchongensis]|uniref:carboxylate-amine ligase n=1 Tax=Nocardia tengchongensis TaxID=2055889 RepID=UPI00364D7D4D
MWKTDTVGVEEEFLLVDPEGGPLAKSSAMLSWLRANVKVTEPARFKPELQPVQIEAVSAVHTEMAALGADLTAMRGELAAAGRACGASVLPVGTAPRTWDPEPDDHADGRHASIHDRFREMMRVYTACGMHVHVGVGEPDLAVGVLNHLRPWLPTLIAVGANSPFHNGRDSGYSSWRVAEQARFPGAGLPPFARSADDYDDRVATLVDCGVLLDEHMSFWLARPSDAYPTVEVRAADTAATIDDALLQAVLARGLVHSALTKLAVGAEGPRFDEQVGAAAVWSAARHGLTGPAIDPIGEARVPASHMLDGLIAWIADELEESGDVPLLRRLLSTLNRRGTGAARQRLAARSGFGDLVEAFGLPGPALTPHRPHRGSDAAHDHAECDGAAVPRAASAIRNV